MSEPAAILARAYLAAYQTRADSYDPETEHHRLSVPEAVAAAGVAPILRQPVEALLGSERGEEIHAWALKTARGKVGSQ
jgi:hypothetical protein